MSSDGREWIALMRRHYLHLLFGGSLRAVDMERHIEDAEDVQAKLEVATEALRRIARGDISPAIDFARETLRKLGEEEQG